MNNQICQFEADQSTLEVLSARPWMDTDVPADALAVPTMLSYRERQLLHWLARNHVTGVGRIVDGGCFLGGSTAALGSGLAARIDGSWERTIAVYDMFRVEEYTLPQFGHHYEDSTIGASFRRTFDTNIEPWSQHLEVREGDACEWGWSSEPIEVLFLDMVKTWRVNHLVLKEFMPCLIPGHSVIVQQDYLWGYGPWTHMTMELLADSVEILDFMPWGSVAYLLTAPVPAELLGINLREMLSPQRKQILMDRAVSRWQGEERGLVELARVMLTAELHGVAAARSEFADVMSRYRGQERVEQCGPSVARHLA